MIMQWTDDWILLPALENIPPFEAECSAPLEIAYHLLFRPENGEQFTGWQLTTD